jgi:hypothetical protein
VTAVKSWLNFPFTKTPSVVYTVAEGLAPNTGAAIWISYGDLDKNAKHSPWSHGVDEELNRVWDTIICSEMNVSGIIAIILCSLWVTIQ